ncbi:MAG: glycosyltransferase [Pyramidobacter sp.]|jgi:glycogen(starch) synthase
MKVLMLGWEFPPAKSGGLGTACYGITDALVKKGIDVLFVMPQTDLDEHPVSHVKLRSASGTLIPTYTEANHVLRATPARSAGKNSSAKAVEAFAPKDLSEFCEHLILRGIRSALKAYDSPATYRQRRIRQERASSKAGSAKSAPFPLNGEESLFRLLSTPAGETPKELFCPAIIHGGYGPDLMSEVYRYSLAAAEIALEESFDVIHVHDWMTYPAGILIKQLTGKPLVAHAHALEHDRSGRDVNDEIAHIEWAGLTAADCVVAVSSYTKNEIMRLYKIPGEKIEVVHNAVNRHEMHNAYHIPLQPHREKRVLFMGRITYQKGPDYFVEAARLVHSVMPDVHFVMAGSGDMFYRMVRRVAELRMGTVFHFPGFQSGVNVERMYANCDLYVMPSVSEPFGIAPLEAMICDIPVIISRQSGVAEVVHNALKVDFWDIHDMADKICAVLAYPRLADEMVKNSRADLRRIKWSTAAGRLCEIYRRCLDRR